MLEQVNLEFWLIETKIKCIIAVGRVFKKFMVKKVKKFVKEFKKKIRMPLKYLIFLVST